MKTLIIPFLAVAVFASLSACSDVADKTATSVSDTTTTVAHNADPFATDTTTKTTQRSLQQPVDATASSELHDSN